MSAFLHNGEIVDQASSVFLLITAYLASRGAVDTLPALALTISIAAAVVEKYFAWRVALDARLFMVLARHAGDAKDFDAALALCLARPVAGTRTLQSRWRGAQTLWRRQLFLCALQIVLTCSVLAGVLITR